MTLKGYGKELIFDLHHCDVTRFNRDELKRFFCELCILIKVEQADLHFWDDVGVPENERQTDPRLIGTSAVQFILTSSIVIHTLDMLGTVYLNIFSCDDFDSDNVIRFVRKWFNGEVVNHAEIDRL